MEISKMIKNIYLLLAVALGVSCQSTTFTEIPSPCPNVFKYVPPRADETPGPGTEKWYGVVTLTTDTTLHGLWLNIVLDRKADILGNWIGEVTTEDNVNFKIENTNMKLLSNTPISVRFFIQYKAETTKPKLRIILFNGRDICNTDAPSIQNITQNTISKPNNYDSIKGTVVKPGTGTTTARSTTLVSTTNVYNRYQTKLPNQQTTTESATKIRVTKNDNKTSPTASTWSSLATKIDNKVIVKTGDSQQTKKDNMISVTNNYQLQLQNKSGNIQQSNNKITKNEYKEQSIQTGTPKATTENYVQVVYGTTANSKITTGSDKSKVTSDNKQKVVIGDKIEMELWSQNISPTNENIRLNSEQTKLETVQGASGTTYNLAPIWDSTDLGQGSTDIGQYPQTSFTQQEYTQTRPNYRPMAITANSNYYIETNGQTIQTRPINKEGNDGRLEAIPQAAAISTSPEMYSWSQEQPASVSKLVNSQTAEDYNGSNNGGLASINQYQVSTYSQSTDVRRPIVDYTANQDPPIQQDGIYFEGGLPTLYIPRRPEPTCGKVTLRSPTYLPTGSTTSEGQWPWQAAIYQQQTVDFKYICGGTLVSNKHVITAAHCVARKNSRREVNQNTLTVYFGKFNLRTSVEGVQIELVNKITIHPDYNPMIFSRNLAILELRKAVSYTHWVRPACLWPDNDTDLRHIVGKKGSIVGWGAEVTGVSKEELHLIEMPVVSQEICVDSYIELYEKFTSDYTYCAGYTDDNSVCNGDSGGGMVFKKGQTWYLRGLVSISVTRSNEYRCDPSHYVIFTDIAKFLTWIKQNIN